MTIKKTTTGSVEAFVEAFSDVYTPWQTWELVVCENAFNDEQWCEPFSGVAWGEEVTGSVTIAGSNPPIPAHLVNGVVHCHGVDTTVRPTEKEGSVYVSGSITWSRTWAASPSGDVRVVGEAAIRFEPVFPVSGGVTVQGDAVLQGPLGVGVFEGDGSITVAGSSVTDLPKDIEADATVHVEGFAETRYEPTIVVLGTVHVAGSGITDLPKAVEGAGVVHVAGAGVVELPNDVEGAGVVFVAGAGVVDLGDEVEPNGTVLIAGNVVWEFVGGSPPIDPGASCAEAGELTFDVDQEGSVGMGANHWYKFPISNGTTYHVTLTLRNGTSGSVNVLVGTTCGDAALEFLLDSSTCNSFVAGSGETWTFLQCIPGFFGNLDYTLNVGTGACP